MCMLSIQYLCKFDFFFILCSPFFTFFSSLFISFFFQYCDYSSLYSSFISVINKLELNKIL